MRRNRESVWTGSAHAEFCEDGANRSGKSFGAGLAEAASRIGRLATHKWLVAGSADVRSSLVSAIRHARDNPRAESSNRRDFEIPVHFLLPSQKSTFQMQHLFESEAVRDTRCGQAPGSAATHECDPLGSWYLADPSL
jgi:hypothetical protein